MAFVKRKKQDVTKKEPFSFGQKKKNGKPSKDGTVVTFKDGTKTTLLNPSGKGKKYAFELSTGTMITNGGDFKHDANGNEIPLSKEQRVYRLAYLTAQKDSANAYKAKKAKKNSGEIKK